MELSRCNNFEAINFPTSLHPWGFTSIFQSQIYTVSYVPLLNKN